MSTRSIYVASPEGHTGKSSIALGLVNLLAGQVRRVGVFRPIMRSGVDDDTVLRLLLNHEAIDLTYEECVGVTYEEVHANPDGALNTIITRYRDRKSTRLNSSHVAISYAVFCLKKKKQQMIGQKKAQLYMMRQLVKWGIRTLE